MFAIHFAPSNRPTVLVRQCPSVRQSVFVSAGLRPCLTHVCTGHVYLSAENGTELPTASAAAATTITTTTEVETRRCGSALGRHGVWVISAARVRRSKNGGIVLLCERHVCMFVFLKSFSAALSPLCGLSPRLRVFVLIGRSFFNSRKHRVKAFKSILFLVKWLRPKFLAIIYVLKSSLISNITLIFFFLFSKLCKIYINSFIFKAKLSDSANNHQHSWEG